MFMYLRNLCFFGLAVAIALGATVTVANEPPPGAADPISLDRASTSVTGGFAIPSTPGDIYGEVPAGGIGFGWDVGGPGPVMHITDGSYGLVGAPVLDNNDGHSNGEADPTAQQVIYFSGDDSSAGVPGTHYDHQAVRLQAAGDRFVTNGAAVGTPAGVMGGGVATVIGPPVFGGFPVNLLSANQTRYNEIPSIAPPVLNVAALGLDDMDALELTPIDMDGSTTHTAGDTPIYFSLDAASPSLAAAGGTTADVLVAAPGAGGFTIFAPALALGLAATDDVDALAVWNMAGGVVHAPAAMTDFALFSLAPGSPFLLGGFSAADIFVTDFSGTNTLFLPAAAIGMLSTDNVDALDVEVWTGPGSVEVFDMEDVPEPSTLILLAIGGLTLGLIRRRKG